MGSGGVITLLFTDIEASTRRWQDDRDDMADALAAHDAVLRDVVKRHGGDLFKHTGDGICAAFGAPSDALAAAVEAQTEVALPVRMGLHTGEAERRDGDYFGPTLNLCARVMDAGHGGQILLSEVTTSLVDGVTTVDLGAHVLKGIERPQRIFQVGADEFPPLRVPRSSNLPGSLTSLIGRDALVAEVTAAVDGSRLVTLTGTGGVGKTRLALAVAEASEALFDAVAFVGLQEVADGDDVVPAVCRALRLKTPSIDSITVSLSRRRALVWVDNCEHVLDAVADLVETLLADLPTCHVLATSREGLAVSGERVIPVPGLANDGADAAGAVLFTERVRQRDPSFAPDEASLEVIRTICDRLDGLPLAIELAAARIGVLTPTELRDRLDDRFGVLTGGRRRRSRDRQRTLRETVDWSYDLLDADERRAFERLSVFAGSFDLAGAVAVIEGHHEAEVLDLVEALVDKSLLDVGDHAGARRYRYLETIRSYAEDRLADRGDTGVALAALHEHLALTVPTLIAAVPETMRDGEARLRVEVPNLRRCFERALDHGDLDAAVALIGPFGAIAGMVEWQIHGWADEALTLPGANESAELVGLRAVDRWLDNDFAAVRGDIERMLHLAVVRPALSESLLRMAVQTLPLFGQVDRMVALLNDARRSPHGLDANFHTSCWLFLATCFSGAAGEVARILADDGLRHLAESAMTDPVDIVRASAHQSAAVLAVLEGRPAEGVDFGRASRELTAEGSAFWFYSLQLGMWAELKAGDIAAAIDLADQNLATAYRIADRSAMILPMAAYGIALQMLNEPEAAAVVRGRLPQRLTILFVTELVELDRWLANELDERALADLTARGAAMEPRDLQSFARDIIERHLESPA